MKISRDYLCQLIADRKVEEMTLEELQDIVAEEAYEDYMQYYAEGDLLQEAAIYGIIDEDETMEIES